MSSTKIVIIVLILIAVIFVVSVTYGSLFAEQPERGGKDEAIKAINDGKLPDWAKPIKNAFKSMQPKLALPCASQSNESVTECDRLKLIVNFTISPDKDNSFRTATFHLRSGNAHIRYVDNNKDAGELKEQDFKLPNNEAKDKSRSSITVSKLGGTLTVECLNNSACQVELE